MPTDWNGSISVTRAKRKFTLPRSLANVKRQGWAKKRLDKTKNRKYLAWTTRRQDASCWWCQYKIQTREHLFNCPQWESQQKTLWTTVLEETRKLPAQPGARTARRSRSCSPTSGAARRFSIFLATTDVGRMAGPPVAEDAEAAASEASEWYK